MLVALSLLAVTATPSSAADPVVRFGDVASGAWYTTAIEWMADEGLTTGTQTGCFEPDRHLTRAQVAVFMHRLADSPKPSGPPPFGDVGPGWSSDAIAWMAESGVTTGVAPGRFAPDLPVTRGQFAAFLHRFEGSPSAPALHFVDIEEEWQRTAVAWLASTGITSGTSPSTFSPDRVLTRAELAVMFHRRAEEPPSQAGLPTTICTRPLVFHAVGDVNFEPGYGPNPARPFADAWTGVGGLFLRDDLTIINLECTPSTLGTAVPKTYNFRCPVESLGPTKAAGVDVANLANNHAGDYGIEAMLDGAANVAAVGIHPVGIGNDLAAATTPVIVERNGITIAVLGFYALGAHPSWLAGPATPGMAFADVETLSAAVRAADELADYVFVTIHWGIELTRGPMPDDVERAHAAIAAGADAVFGHHPHVLQPLEFHAGRPIFWSLGNFVWHNRISRTGVAEVTITHSGDISARIIPAVMERSGHPVLTG